MNRGRADPVNAVRINMPQPGGEHKADPGPETGEKTTIPASGERAILGAGCGKTAMISVIIPAYNEAGHIRPTLENLASARALLGVEVIVSDDGSADGTLEAALGRADLIIRPVHGQRTGPGAARNRGAAKSRGDLLVFLDADSRIRDPLGFFGRIEEVFSARSLAAATCRLAVEPEEAGPLVRALHLVQDLVIMAENLVNIHVSGGWCQIVDRAAFVAVGGYDEDLSVSQDVDLFKRLGRLGRTRLIPGLLVYESPRRYRERGLIRTYLVRIVNSLAVLGGGRPTAGTYRRKRPAFH